MAQGSRDGERRNSAKRAPSIPTGDGGVEPGQSHQRFSQGGKVPDPAPGAAEPFTGVIIQTGKPERSPAALVNELSGDPGEREREVIAADPKRERGAWRPAGE